MVTKLEGERFKRVPGFSNLAASTLGRIVDLTSEELVEFTAEVEGGHFRYNRRTFQSDTGVSESFRPHQIIMRTFGEPKPYDDAIILHYNDDDADNRIENLRWGSQAENAADRVRNAKDFGPKREYTDKEKASVVIFWRSGSNKNETAQANGYNPKVCRQWATKVKKEWPSLSRGESILESYALASSIKTLAKLYKLSVVTLLVFLYEEGALGV